MSGRYASQQSAIMLDVSQRDNSSQSSSPISKAGGDVSRQRFESLDDDKATVQVGETVDVVQDSFELPRPPAKANLEAEPETNGATPASHREDDEEEMYGLSPKGQSQHEMTKAARQSTSKSHVIRDNEANESAKDRQTFPSAAARSPAPAQPVDDDAPTQSTAVPQRPANQHSRNASQMQAATEKSSAPATRLQKTAAAAMEASAQATTQPTQPDVQTKSTSKMPVRAAKQSALEALRAKNGREQDSPRSAKAENTSSTAVTQPKAPLPGPGASKKLPKQSKQLPTPATKGTADRSDRRPATGKLPTYQPRSRMTPNVEPVNGAPEVGGESIAPGADDECRERRRIANHTGTLKRPPKKDQAAELREQQKVALQSANDSHGKRGRGGLKRVARDESRGALRREQTDTYDLATPATKRQRRSMSRASKASTVKTVTGGRTRQRMQETSNQPLVGRDDSQLRKEVPDPSRPRQDSQDVDAAHGVEQLEQPKRAVEDRGVRMQTAKESIVQQEQTQDVAFSAGHGDQPIKPTQEGDDTEAAGQAVTTQDAAKEKAPDHGIADQEDTTVLLSDRNGPDPCAATAARTDEMIKPPSDRIIDQAKRPRPQTPAFRSSRQKLDDRRNNVQSSAAKTDKTTHSMHYTASNVAADGEDVFSAFALGAKTSNLAETLRPKPKAPTCQHPNAEAPDNEPTDDFAKIDDLEGTTMIYDDQPPVTVDDEPTVSQVAMPPPGGKAKRADKRVPRDEMTKEVESVEVDGTPYVPFKRKDVAKASPGKASQAPRPVAGTKRKPAPMAEVESAKKRGRPDQTRSLRTLDTRAEEHGSDVGGITPQTEDIKLKQKPVKQVQPEPVKRALRRQQKPLRQAQGSVDITGSPYPKSMDVPKRSTALEVFSQQAGLSSDQDFENQARSLADERSYSLKQTVRLPPPSAELEILSSNSKPLPAPPQAMSQAVCRIASGAAAEKLLIRDQAREPPTDPFTSSEEQRQSDQPAHETGFLKALRESGFGLKPQAGMSLRTSDAVEDPDKTLVEPEPPRLRPAKGKKRAISISSDSSPDSASQSQRSDIGEDVAAWRDALKPYQADLFDSLVVVSHKLVRHLVDCETATADIIADYRRRGERIVSSLEKSSADLFDKRVRMLADNKKQTRKELKLIKESLQSARDDSHSANSVAGARKKGRSKLENMLQEMIANYE